MNRNRWPACVGISGRHDRNTQGKANYWYFPKGAAVLDLPSIEPAVALAWLMSRATLAASLPRSGFAQLGPYFERAEAVLNGGGSKLARWRRKFRVCARGPRLRAIEVDPAVQDAVHRAVLEEKMLQLGYRGRGHEAPAPRTVHPFLIVQRDGVFYLVGTVLDYTDPVHFALHRISQAEVLDTPARIPREFDADAYVEREFRYPVRPGRIRLVAEFDEDAALHLRERPLADDQKMTDKDGTVTLSATVDDTEELHWWLLGFGDRVEVLKPAALRREFREIARNMARHYTR